MIFIIKIGTIFSIFYLIMKHSVIINKAIQTKKVYIIRYIKNMLNINKY